MATAGVGGRIEVRPNTTARIYMMAIALLGWFALLLQFYLTVIRTSGGAAMVVKYFSYFTILTNLLIAVGLTACLLAPHMRWGRFFSHPVVQAGSAVYIFMVGVTYLLLLCHIWDPRGLQKIADTLLHDVIPVLYVLYWLIFAPKISMTWGAVLRWLIYPLSYVAYVLFRGAVSGEYPYPFIDARALGCTTALTNAVGLAVAFLVVGLIVVAISRSLGRQAEKQEAMPPAPPSSSRAVP